MYVTRSIQMPNQMHLHPLMHSFARNAIKPLKREKEKA